MCVRNIVRAPKFSSIMKTLIVISDLDTFLNCLMQLYMWTDLGALVDQEIIVKNYSLFRFFFLYE